MELKFSPISLKRTLPPGFPHPVIGTSSYNTVGQDKNLESSLSPSLIPYIKSVTKSHVLNTFRMHPLCSITNTFKTFILVKATFIFHWVHSICLLIVLCFQFVPFYYILHSATQVILVNTHLFTAINAFSSIFWMKSKFLTRINESL